MEKTYKIPPETPSEMRQKSCRKKWKIERFFTEKYK